MSDGRPYWHWSHWKFYIFTLVVCQLFFIWLLLRNDIYVKSVASDHGLPQGRNDIFLEACREFISQAPTKSPEFYQYSDHLSNSLGAIRKLPRTRHESCDSKTYQLPHPSMGNVSVVISFHNEARSMLLRTIVSLLIRTSEEYLHELIILDDGSQDATLLDDLKRWWGRVYSSQSRLRLIFLANTQRKGLIWSRNRGASVASGHYVLFLDSHCEVNEGWLEPLLERLALNPRLAVSPLLDTIDPTTLSYRKGNELLKGGFDWSLHFHWLKRELDKEERPEVPYKSPAFAGGVLMISREWFHKLKCFNPNLKIWGGESIELAIKLWLCGGQIEIVPCSRIGHIFRRYHAFDFPPRTDIAMPVLSMLSDQPPSSAQATYLHNSKIIAESWLDEYKNIFYALRPAAKGIPLNRTNHEEQQQLRRESQCHRFDWYLWHVNPELRLHFDELSAMGTLRNEDRCLHARQRNSKQQQQLFMASCAIDDITQWSLLRVTGQLITQRELCLGVGLQNRLILGPCARIETLRKSQKWVRKGTQLLHEATHLCLDNPLKNRLELSSCRSGAVSQTFQFALEMGR